MSEAGKHFTAREESGPLDGRTGEADVAQLVERVLGKDEVTGSIPVIGSRAWLSGSNSVVESQPSKLLVAGSIPVSRSRASSTIARWKRDS